MVCEVEDSLIGRTLHPGVVPCFDDAGAKGTIAWPGAGIGAHNTEVYADLLGLGDSEMEALRAANAI